ncbi:MAG: hypothetical protein RL455_122 [Actinomycetota bacterium]|jgi:hypothetical protein
MNKKVISLILLSALLTSPLTLANAAVKAGTACKTAGLTSVVSGKTYTCIKSGKKLIWSKGSSSPTPVSNVSPQPTWLKSYSEISRISRNSKTIFNLPDIEISPNVDSRLAANLIRYQNLVTSYWKNIGFESPYPIHMLILSEKDYATYSKYSSERKFSCSDVCNENNWFSPSFSSKFQGTVQVENINENLAGRAAPTGLTILYVIGTEMVSKNYNWAPDLATAFTHEYGHVIQFSYLEGWKNFSYMACWNNEGFPAFYEDAFYFENESETSKLNVLNPPNGTSLAWLTNRLLIRQNGFKYDAAQAFNSQGIIYSPKNLDWIKFISFTDSRNSKGCSIVGYGRNHGSIISRLFYEDFGAKGFLEILKNTNQLKDWRKAFLTTTGSEYDVWLNNRVFPEFNRIS